MTDSKRSVFLLREWKAYGSLFFPGRKPRDRKWNKLIFPFNNRSICFINLLFTWIKRRKTRNDHISLVVKCRKCIRDIWIISKSKEKSSSEMKLTSCIGWWPLPDINYYQYHLMSPLDLHDCIIFRLFNIIP